jgi:hypothetical protein
MRTDGRERKTGLAVRAERPEGEADKPVAATGTHAMWRGLSLCLLPPRWLGDTAAAVRYVTVTSHRRVPSTCPPPRAPRPIRVPLATSPSAVEGLAAAASVQPSAYCSTLRTETAAAAKRWRSIEYLVRWPYRLLKLVSLAMLGPGSQQQLICPIRVGCAWTCGPGHPVPVFAAAESTCLRRVHLRESSLRECGSLYE